MPAATVFACGLFSLNYFHFLNDFGQDNILGVDDYMVTKVLLGFHSIVLLETGELSLLRRCLSKLFVQ